MSEFSSKHNFSTVKWHNFVVSSSIWTDILFACSTREQNLKIIECENWTNIQLFDGYWIDSSTLCLSLLHEKHFWIEKNTVLLKSKQFLHFTYHTGSSEKKWFYRYNISVRWPVNGCRIRSMYDHNQFKFDFSSTDDAIAIPFKTISASKFGSHIRYQIVVYARCTSKRNNRP